MSSRAEALEEQRGQIELTFCQECAFVWNSRFDNDLLAYSPRYEETKACSETFAEYDTVFAKGLIERYNLKGKTVLEIGCGKGKFLQTLSKLADIKGIGIDPSYIPERNHAHTNLKFIRELFSEKHTSIASDLICCKMTLEHITDVENFVSLVRKAAPRDRGIPIVFQVPNFAWTLEHFAFWDIYYEHCSYFTELSLGRLFRNCGYQVLRIYSDYGDQYLTIEAEASREPRAVQDDSFGTDLRRVKDHIETFTNGCEGKKTKWTETLAEAKRKSQRVVLWGAASKAITFLNVVPGGEHIEYTVDINPHRQSTFLPGTGAKIQPPSFLVDYRPDLVIVANPIYYNEIFKSLNDMGVKTRVDCL